MTCQNCGKNLATTHVKKTMNGKTTELHLCAACAAKQGLNTVWDGLGLDLGNFWGSLFAEPLSEKKPTPFAANAAGAPSAISRKRQSRLSGLLHHLLRSASPLDPPDPRQNAPYRQNARSRWGRGQKGTELDVLKKQLAESIASQEYEKCAELRDSIRALEEGRHDGE